MNYNALYGILKQKKIAGAALDVYPEEPLAVDSLFLTLDNVTLTSHRAGATKNSFQNVLIIIRKELDRFFSGIPLENRVN